MGTNAKGMDDSFPRNQPKTLNLNSKYVQEGHLNTIKEKYYSDYRFYYTVPLVDFGLYNIR
jgi:hypothetical protein